MPMDRLNNYTVEVLDLDSDTSIAAAGTDDQLVKPPKGFVYEVINIEYNGPNPAGSGAGTHQLEGFLEGGLTRLFVARSGFGDSIYIGSVAFTGTSLEEPAGVGDQYDLMRRTIVATNTVFLTLTYTNNTDVAAALTRGLRVTVKKYREAV